MTKRKLNTEDLKEELNDENSRINLELVLNEILEEGFQPASNNDGKKTLEQINREYCEQNPNKAHSRAIRVRFNENITYIDIKSLEEERLNLKEDNLNEEVQATQAKKPKFERQFSRL